MLCCNVCRQAVFSLVLFSGQKTPTLHSHHGFIRIIGSYPLFTKQTRVSIIYTSVWAGSVVSACHAGACRYVPRSGMYALKKIHVSSLHTRKCIYGQVTSSPLIN